MTRRSGIGAVLLLLLLGGPLGLLEVDHGHFHAHPDDARHPDCPVCFAAKEPVVIQLPSAPLILPEPARFPPAPRPDSPEAEELVRGTPPRGPPAAS